MKVYLFGFVVLLIFSCKVSSDLKMPYAAQDENWRNTFNSGMPLDSYYAQHAALYINDTIFQGEDLVNEEMRTLKTSIKGIKYSGSVKVIEHDSSHYFDIGLHKGINKDLHAYLIAWNKSDGIWKREFEAVNPFDKTAKVDTAGVNTARKKWELLSNSHHHQSLIEQSYTADAIYLSRGMINIGWAEIIERYAYMSDPNWQIELTPIQLLAVKENMVYEVGQYKSGGIGHYFIIWEQDENGEWKVRLDFNFF